MKQRNVFAYLAAALLVAGACSKDDDTGNGKPDGGEEPEKGIFVLTGQKSPVGSEILFTANSLDSGVLVTDGTGIEQDGATHHYSVNNGIFFSRLFAQSSPGDVTAYRANATGNLERLTHFQTETMTMYGNVGDEILMFKNAWQPEEQFTQWFRLDAKTQQIVGQGEIDAEALTGNTGKAFFMDILQVGDKVFAPFWNVESGLSFASDYLDSTWIAVYSYPSMQLEKVIRDGRTGSIGALMVRGTDVDENGDVYVFGMKLGWNKSGQYDSETPSGILKIKKGTTEYDPSFFYNLTDATGDEYVWRKNYLGKGYFLLTVVPQPFAYATMFYARAFGGVRYAVVNVYDGSFKWVTGTPANTTIQSTSGEFNYSALDGTGYVAIYYKEGDADKSTVFKIDGATAAATPGLVTDGKAAITGMYWIPTAE